MCMKTSFLVFTVLALSANYLLPAGAQNSRVKRSDPNTHYRAPQTMRGKMIVLPIGTTFEGRISKTVSSAKSHMGESFSIVLAAPILANGIDVVVPAGSEVICEIVEAVSSKKQPRKKNMPIPKGKLRIQITQLRTPDGTSFPLVASLIGEEDTQKGRGRIQGQLGSSVGYVGTAESFEAIAPGANRYGKQYTSQRGPDYVKKREFLAHEIYGNAADDFKNAGGDNRRIRSLVLRKMDLWIDEGSPLTVKLQAPLRLSITPSNAGMPVGAVEKSLGDDIPGPSSGPDSQGGESTDIPRIGDDSNVPGPGPDMQAASPRAAAPQEPIRRNAPQPQAQTPQPQAPGLSPSADF